VEARTAAYAAGRPDDDPRDEDRGLDAYVAEFIGTMLLVFFVCTVVVMNSASGIGVTDWAVIGLVHFLLLAVLVHTLGGASGAHFNPAVTVTLAALRKISPPNAVIYVVLQIAGGLAAVLLIKLLISNEADPANYGAPALSDRFIEEKALSGFLIEAMGTFVLMWAIMGTAVNPRGARDWAGLAIGGALGFAVMTLGPLTGAGLNPARSLAPAIVGEAFNGFGNWFVAFTLGPLVGALLAGTIYTAFILAPQGRGGGVKPEEVLSGDREDVD
jgi:MIP family channel proteins